MMRAAEAAQTPPSQRVLPGLPVSRGFSATGVHATVRSTTAATIQGGVICGACPKKRTGTLPILRRILLPMERTGRWPSAHDAGAEPDGHL